MTPGDLEVIRKVLNRQAEWFRKKRKRRVDILSPVKILQQIDQQSVKTFVPLNIVSESKKIQVKMKEFVAFFCWAVLKSGMGAELKLKVEE